MQFYLTLLIFLLISPSLAFYPANLSQLKKLPNQNDSTQFSKIKLVRRKNPAKGMARLLKRDSANATLYSDNSKTLFGFVGKMGVGTPPQYLDVVFDTGSFVFWVRSSTCTTALTCKGLPSFNPSKSSTFDSKASLVYNPIEYFDGTSVSGDQVADTLGLGWLYVDKSFKWLLATDIKNPSSTDPMGIDGIVGLGMSYSGIQSPVFFDSLMTKGDSLLPGKLSSNIYSYYIDDTDENGEILFGAIDSARIKSVFQWTAVTDKFGNKFITGHWTAEIKSIKVDSTKINIGSNMVVIDTGASLTYLNQSYAETLHKNIYSGFQQQVSTDKLTVYYLCACSLRNSLKDVQINIGSISFTVSPYVYLYEYDASSGSCVSGFIGQDLDSDMVMIIGNILLRGFYAVFDYEKQAFGFASVNRAPVGSIQGNVTVLRDDQRYGSQTSQSVNSAPKNLPTLWTTSVAVLSLVFYLKETW